MSTTSAVATMEATSLFSRKGAEKVLAHGMIGGASSVANGGKFGAGFASMGITQAASISGWFETGMFAGKYGNAIGSGLVGGTASVAAGGDFAMGAVQGAMGRFLNDRAHSKAAQQESEFDRFNKFVRKQGVERRAGEDFIVEQVASKWNDLPASIRNYEPGGYGSIVDDKGHHIENQRLEGGYHLSVDVTNGPVNLHFDAYDPLKGPIENYKHWYHEVRRINNGSLKVLDPVNKYPDWNK